MNRHSLVIDSSGGLKKLKLKRRVDSKDKGGLNTSIISAQNYHTASLIEKNAENTSKLLMDPTERSPMKAKKLKIKLLSSAK